MGLKGKLIAEFEARSSGDLFHEIFASKPYHISKISPTHIRACDLQEGEFGKNGSVVMWNYTNNGKACVSKMVVENLDEVNKTITYKEIEGDLLKSYKTFSVHIHVKTGPGNVSLINWTLDYEKLHDDVPHPISILEIATNSLSKNIEDYHLKA